MDRSIPSICSYISRKIPTWNSEFILYAQTVQKIAESNGDQAALQYDEKFRRWRQKDTASCPWQQKNAELFQEALVLGLDYKLKSKKQQPFRAPLKHRYCYAYNNHGTCPKENACPPPSRLSNLCRQTLSKIPAQAVLRPSPFNQKVRLLPQ